MPALRADQIWNIMDLRVKITDAIKRLQEDGHGESAAAMAAVIAPAGYHQKGEIAEVFGLPDPEQGVNEDEIEPLLDAMRKTTFELLQDLNALIPLPAGVALFWGYDREGNYGLLVRLEDSTLFRRCFGPGGDSQFCFPL